MDSNAEKTFFLSNVDGPLLHKDNKLETIEVLRKQLENQRKTLEVELRELKELAECVFQRCIKETQSKQQIYGKWLN